MNRKPQQQTLSVRISEGLRTYLERAREAMSSAQGESVSTSDVAKMLLERAKEDRLDDRLELTDLLREPTETLLTIRQKWEQKRVLARAEWIALAQYIQTGCEGTYEDPELPRADSFAQLLEAFLALQPLRKAHDPKVEQYYLSNLGASTVIPSKHPPHPERLSESVQAVIQDLRRDDSKTRPLFAGRNLYVALRDEDLGDLAGINQALFPYLPTLYRLAARGHWLQEHRPVRPRRDTKDYSYRPSVFSPVISESLRLSIVLTDEGDLAMALDMPNRDVVYPLEPYPKIREFATMLERLQPAAHWKGREFFAYTDAIVPDQVTHFYFRHRSNGIAVGFSPEDWNCLREVFRTALALPELGPTLSELSLQYGEV